MPKRIKTKNLIKDIKLFDRSANLGTRAKSAFIRSKQSAVTTQKHEHRSENEYAIDKTSSYVKDTVQKATQRAREKLEHPVKNLRNRFICANESFQEVKNLSPKQRQNTATQAQKIADTAKKTASTLKGNAGQARRTSYAAERVHDNTKRALQQAKQAGRRSIQQAKKTAKSAQQAEKAVSGSGKISKYAKNSIKVVKKSVKTANHSAQTAVKTAKQIYKSAHTTAQTSAKAAKAAARSSKIAAQNAVKTAEAATKVVAATVKSAVAAAKGTTALIAAGGWVAVVIIIVVCMAGMVLSMGFMPGNGEIVQSKSQYIPKGIFTWMFEEDYPVSSPFGDRIDPFSGEIAVHYAVDIAAPEGTPILAMADGLVSMANFLENESDYGYYVMLEHGDGYETLYAHCARVAVVVGQEVKRGQIVAWVGSTGKSTGAHLHAELWEDGVRTNLLDYFE